MSETLVAKRAAEEPQQRVKRFRSGLLNTRVPLSPLNQSRAAHNGSNSPLLRLPAEIRNRIFEYALGGQDIKVDMHPSRTASARWPRLQAYALPADRRIHPLGNWLVNTSLPLWQAHDSWCFYPSAHRRDCPPEHVREAQVAQERRVQAWLGPASRHAVMDYQMQLMLLEQQNKKRLLMARMAQDGSPPQNNAAPPPTPFAPFTSFGDLPYVETELRDSTSPYLVPKDSPGASYTLGLLRTCRQFHHEACLLPYELNCFSFNNERSFRAFMTSLKPCQRRALRTLALHSPMLRCPFNRSHLQDLSGLRTLYVPRDLRDPPSVRRFGGGRPLRRTSRYEEIWKRLDGRITLLLH